MKHEHDQPHLQFTWDAAFDRPTAVAAPRVFDSVNGAYLHDHAVVIDGASISWIGPSSALPISDPVINFPGATLLPGLIDAHAHLAWDAWVDDREEVPDCDQVRTRALLNAAAHLHRGVTTIRDLGAPSGGVLAAAERLRQDDFDVIFGAGRAIGTPGGHASAIARGERGPAAMRRAVEEEIAAGARCIKVMATGGVLGPNESPFTIEVDAEELNAIVATAHAGSVPVAVHAHATAAIETAVRAGADSIEHASGLDAQTAALMAEHGTRMIPTLSGLELTSTRGESLGFPDFLVAKAQAAFAAARQATAAAIRSGVVIVPGTDAGVPGQEHGNLVRELEAIARAGLSTVGCLQGATAYAADLLNAGDRGRLTVGARADLVVVAGDPLSDLSCLDQVRLVVAGGKRIHVAGPLTASSP